MKLEKSQAVYVIYNPELNITKVGISEHPNLRRKTLECACGCSLELIYSSPHFTNAYVIESLCHVELKDSRRLGEWFNCSIDMAKEVVIKQSKKGKLDSVIQAYKEGETISAIAERAKVTRQAIINKLSICGLHEKKPSDKQVKKITTAIKKGKPITIEDNEHKDVSFYLDTESPNSHTQWLRAKRIEPNIKQDGEIYQVSTYVNGQFRTAYTKDLDKARQFRDQTSK